MKWRIDSRLLVVDIPLTKRSNESSSSSSSFVPPEKNESRGDSRFFALREWSPACLFFSSCTLKSVPILLRTVFTGFGLMAVKFEGNRPAIDRQRDARTVVLTRLVLNWDRSDRRGWKTPGGSVQILIRPMWRRVSRGLHGGTQDAYGTARFPRHDLSIHVRYISQGRQFAIVTNAIGSGEKCDSDCQELAQPLRETGSLSELLEYRVYVCVLLTISVYRRNNSIRFPLSRLRNFYFFHLPNSWIFCYYCRAVWVNFDFAAVVGI